MSFWQLSSGELPSGTAEASHTGDFRVIPDNTQAPAQITEFMLIESPKRFYEASFKITYGEFKDRIVRLKIKCFDEKPNIKDRGINMLKRVYDLCGHKPTHNNIPTTQDLHPMIGKVLGIKIKEFIGTKEDGSPSNGNYVSEIHKADKEFETLTGIKLDVYVSPVPSALTRNQPTGALPDDGIPF
jgi:hypothetical protein